MSPAERARRLLEDAFRLSEEGRLQAAIEACNEAISLNPSSTSAYSLLGTLSERAGDRDGAIRAYEQVLSLSPGSTAERRRLNELMGVPTAPGQAAVSPRTARMAVTGGFVVVALILVGAIVLTTQRPERAGRQRRPRAPVPARQAVATAEMAPTAPAGLAGLGRIRVPRFVTAQPAPAPAPVPRQAARTGFGQWVGPGAYVIPSSGWDAYGGAAGARTVARGPTPPMQGARPISAQARPMIRTPGWRYPAEAVVAGGATRLAHSYYYQGNYPAAIDAYRGYLAATPQPDPVVREELAWVYTEAGQHQAARREYRTALKDFEADLSRRHNVEAAKHGVRTCESAIRALESE